MCDSLKKQSEFREGTDNLNAGSVPRPELSEDGKEAFREEKEFYKFED